MADKNRNGVKKSSIDTYVMPETLIFEDQLGNSLLGFSEHAVEAFDRDDYWDDADYANSQEAFYGERDE